MLQISCKLDKCYINHLDICNSIFKIGVFMSSSEGWGGKRENAGRKRQGEKLAKDSTKVIRVSEKHYARIKNGSYDEIIHILRERRETMEDSKNYRDSPRWAKLWQLMDEIENVLGSDWQGWED